MVANVRVADCFDVNNERSLSTGAMLDKRPDGILWYLLAHFASSCSFMASKSGLKVRMSFLSDSF